MDAFEVLHTRRSIRQFLNRPVGADLVKELLRAAMSAPTAAMENLLLAARAKELASLWCGVHPVPEREQAFRELFNLPDTVSPLGLAILGYSETPFSHKERYDEQKVHYNVW